MRFDRDLQPIRYISTAFDLGRDQKVARFLCKTDRIILRLAMLYLHRGWRTWWRTLDFSSVVIFFAYGIQTVVAAGMRITPSGDVAFPLVKFRIMAEKHLGQWIWFPQWHPKQHRNRRQWAIGN